MHADRVLIEAELAATRAKLAVLELALASAAPEGPPVPRPSAVADD